MPMNLRVCAALGVLICLSVGRVDATAPAEPASAPLGKLAGWTVNKPVSKIEFTSAFGGTPFGGSFKTWDAHIAFDPDALAASKVSVTVDLASAVTGDRTRDEALPTAEWFDAAKFPQATFVTKSFKSLGGGRYEATADLSIRGVTRQVVLPFTLTIAGDRATMKGAVTIMRNAFNLGTGYFADASSIPFDVGVLVSLSAMRSPGG